MGTKSVGSNGRIGKPRTLHGRLQTPGGPASPLKSVAWTYWKTQHTSLDVAHTPLLHHETFAECAPVAHAQHTGAQSPDDWQAAPAAFVPVMALPPQYPSTDSETGPLRKPAPASKPPWQPRAGGPPP